MTQFRFPSFRRGIGLLELMLSLLVIVTLVFMAARYFQVSSENLRITQAVDMINSTVNASYKWLEGKPNFTGISTQELVAAGLLPDSYKSTNANPWHGALAVIATDNANHILITMENVTTKSCTALLQRMQKYVVTGGTLSCQPEGTAATFEGEF